MNINKKDAYFGIGKNGTGHNVGDVLSYISENGSRAKETDWSRWVWPHDRF